MTTKLRPILLTTGIFFCFLFCMSAPVATAEESSEEIPKEYLIKNTPEEILIGDQVSPSYETAISATQSKIHSAAEAPSDKAFEVLCVSHCDQSSDTALQISAPIYSNTNYTLEIKIRNKLESRGAYPVLPAKIGLVEDIIADNKEAAIAGNKYVTYSLPFRTNSKHNDFQEKPQESPVGFRIFKDIEENTRLYTSIIEAKLVPFQPEISVKDRELKVNFSDVIGKTRQEILTTYAASINDLLKSASTDANNNDNPVPTSMEPVLEPETKIQSPQGSFSVIATASKWGAQNQGKLKITIIDDQEKQTQETKITSTEKQNPSTRTSK